MLLKWCTKAMLYDVDGIFALNEINPVIDQLSQVANVCAYNPTKDQSEALIRAKV